MKYLTMKYLSDHTDYPAHPGTILLEFYLAPLKLNVTEAAKLLSITRPNLSAILNGRAGISAVMAIKLAKAFSTTPQFWMNLQSNYDLFIAQEKNRATLIK